MSDHDSSSLRNATSEYKEENDEFIPRARGNVTGEVKETFDVMFEKQEINEILKGDQESPIVDVDLSDEESRKWNTDNDPIEDLFPVKKVEQIPPPKEDLDVKEPVEYDLAPTMRSYKKVGFVINPIAGKGRVLSTFQSQVLPLIKKMFTSEICCFLTKCKGDGARLAQKYIELGFDVIVSVGGDGTNNDVVNGIMESDKRTPDLIVGFLPLGSACDFVRTIGLDVNNITKSLQALVDCFTIPCDVGLCEATGFDHKSSVKKWFLNISSFGASGAIMKNVNSSPIIVSSEFTYTWHTLATTLRTPNSLVNLNGKDIKTYITSVCNGQFFGNKCWVNPSGSLNDNLLDVIVMGDLSFMEILKAFSSIKDGNHLGFPKIYQDKSLQVVEASPTKPGSDIIIECDGELTGILPAKWTSHRHAFQIIVPKK